MAQRDYVLNKQPKDPRFLAAFRKAFNKDRKSNNFTPEESANEMGLSHGTLEQKLKPSTENDITVTEWNHHLELTGDFSTLEYFALKHGFELKKLDINTKDIPINEVLEDADNAMQESNEAWGKIKSSLKDKKLSKKEKIESLREINEAVKSLQLLYFDVEHIEIEE
ncbi:hypothetical protein CKA55_07410 [Arcobacter suis]|uniref:Uncharacterized protein n=1 Tax=Arcobacter suis CECT 7833 TaxID=663365 RepID=A0AAD0WQD6_9BACT|nr:phage regulatory CII family protein [Arcobacter suis]AXX89323.1 hypothetical protein ASUIS_0832 [Arcobacter suis CECT 7833]RWS46557.1 hypothetical protein CKA55_07410 [Arcobacter suis]